MKYSLLAATLGLLISTSAVSAQDDRFPDSGTWSITASVPDGGGNLFGIWRMFGSRFNVGFEVDYRNKEIEDSGSSAFISSNTVTRDDLVVFGPSVRYYLTTDGPVAPYVRAALGFQRRDIEIAQINTEDNLQNQEESSTIWRLAIGADWFPTENVAIGFFTGLVGVVVDTNIELGNNGTITRRNDNLSTFKSGIELQLFFF